eukprot:scaffold480_cov257-Pinguiococcus_pyrenoidosus.AAC.29
MTFDGRSVPSLVRSSSQSTSGRQAGESSSQPIALRRHRRFQALAAAKAPKADPAPTRAQMTVLSAVSRILDRLRSSYTKRIRPFGGYGASAARHPCVSPEFSRTVYTNPF